ncbi:MAG: hypothetical protein R2789_18335 [Microthrixaceae bacterium]
MTTRPEIPRDVTRPRCPHCQVELELGATGEVDHWSCPRPHGLAMTLSEAHGRLQNDEVAELWELALEAPQGPLPSPFGGPNMVRFVLPWDLDEAREGEPGDTENLGAVELDVDLDNRFIWFDTGELEELPTICLTRLPAPRRSWPWPGSPRSSRSPWEKLSVPATTVRSRNASTTSWRADRAPSPHLTGWGRAMTSY